MKKGSGGTSKKPVWKRKHTKLTIKTPYKPGNYRSHLFEFEVYLPSCVFPTTMPLFLLLYKSLPFGTSINVVSGISVSSFSNFKCFSLVYMTRIRSSGESCSCGESSATLFVVVSVSFWGFRSFRGTHPIIPIIGTEFIISFTSHYYKPDILQ